MQTKLKVEGMTCSHCENAVKKAVSAINEVTDVEIDLKSGFVIITHGENVTENTIKNEIEEQGYDVVVS